MLPSPEPGEAEDSDTARLVLVQLRVQAEVQVQQRTVLLKFLLVAEGVKRHATVLNLQANCYAFYRLFPCKRYTCYNFSYHNMFLFV